MQEFFENILMHVGVSKLDGAPGPGSGRYPLGSGKNPYQHRIDFLARVQTYEDMGLKEREVAEKFGLTATQLRTQISLAKNEIRAYTAQQVRKLREKGMGWTEIARTLGLKNESTARGLMSEKALENTLKAKVTADYLKDMVDKYGMIDVSGGTEYVLGVSKEKLRQALDILKADYGYEVYKTGIPQGAKRTGKQTNQMVLCDTKHSYKDAYDYANVHSVLENDQILTEDGMKVRKAFEYPASLDSKRLQIVYDEDGGTLKDGLVELRRGVEDISLGNDHYAQVRIMVDGTHYIKGMAVYNDDLPDGVDVRFNVHYSKGTPLKGEKGNTVLKPITSDPDNPFGSTIKERGGQRYYDDPKGKFTDPETGKKQSLSVINKRAAEGDWDEWSRNLPSQFLSKQSEILVRRQLKLSEAEANAEYDEICKLTNPTVKKYFLQKFADSCDAAAVHLKAASLPRQRYQVIMPLTTIGDNEIYAPNYKNGEDVVLVRFPYSGPFESPRLKVNNKNPEGRKLLGNNPQDVVGISAASAAKMSGADFDGDTVMVIPVNTKVKVKDAPTLKGLEGFDDKVEYGFDQPPVKDANGKTHYYRKGKEYKIMANTQNEMGRISNLITDMTLKGASNEKLARAVRHSMVVIDAEKHKLDYQASYIDNDIDALKREFQKKSNGKYGGAGTLISRAKGEKTVDKRQGSPRINPETGALEWKTATDLYYPEKQKVKLKDSKGRIIRDAHGDPVYEKDPTTGRPVWVETGRIKKRTQKSTQMYEARDAHELSTGHPIEEVYADYANFQKALANKARKEMISTKGVLYDSGARATYQAEVDSLDAKLKVAERNRVATRDARRMAAAMMNAKKPAYIEAGLTKKELEEELQKEYDRALREARAKTGSKRNPISITDREWEAIQAGAVHENTLKRILEDSDADALREKATPRAKQTIPDSKIALMKAMRNSGNTNEEIAERLGVSVSTIIKYLK